MDNTSRLRILNGRGWSSGFGNLFQASSAGFWHTKKWIIQPIVWLIILNAVLLQIWSTPADIIPELLASYQASFSIELLVQNPLGLALMNFFLFASILPAVTAVIAGQDALIGERQSGTAAWVLSKPVSRSAFILSKMTASTIGLFFTGVLIPGAAAYLQLSVWSKTAWSMGFFGAMGLVFLNLFFYLSLTYMLGSLFNNRGIVLGISLALAIIGPLYLYSVPVLNVITPWTLLMPLGGGMSQGIALTFGQAPEPVLPIIGTVVMCLVFIVVTLWRFHREEF
jgi:ABC-2 type transport system permease protein